MQVWSFMFGNNRLPQMLLLPRPSPLQLHYSKVKLGQAFCSVQPLIGCPYGSTFGVAPDGKTLQWLPQCALGRGRAALGCGLQAALHAHAEDWDWPSCATPRPAIPSLQTWSPHLTRTVPSQRIGWRRRRWR